MTKISSFAWGSMACALISGKVLAVDVNAGDYTALPAGTNVAAWYQQFSRADRFNGDGAPDAKHATSLRSNISILRLIHFTEIGGITVDPQILLPFGHVYNVKVSGQSLGSNSGMADPIIGATFWLVNQPEAGSSGRYFGITPLIYLPWGQYDRDEGINLGENRWKADLQLGWVEPLWGRWSMEWYADAVFHGPNDDAGSGRQTLRQDTTYQLQTNLRYDVNPAQRLALGFSATDGGKQHLSGDYTGQKTEVQQVRLEFQQMLGNSVQLSTQFTHDTRVVGGFREDTGVNLRALLLF
ncbi:transporter [Pseudomonas arcuscaelestis]|uniref:transporter n=1 Tax=Pseudomonas arcuscaelestis TaxID=2710591 RepID=UPI00193EA319|nr:transporter [Pseudomonas arcuscaelestis]MBM3113763.1 transporter [Pseudomonas arcuscaelestis]